MRTQSDPTREAAQRPAQRDEHKRRPTLTTRTHEHARFLQKSERDAKRWSGYVDTLLDAFQSSSEAPPSLGCKLEELRNKRDSVVTKVEALKHHEYSGWNAARRELDNARRELRDAWRTVIGTLDKESLFV